MASRSSVPVWVMVLFMLMTSWGAQASTLTLVSSSASATAFTPDGNGIADTVSFRYEGEYSVTQASPCGLELKLEVRDAKGKLIWHANQHQEFSAEGIYPILWDLSWAGLGTNKQPVPQGTYYTILKWSSCDGEENSEQTGTISIYYPAPGEEVGQIASDEAPLVLSLPEGMVLTVPAGAAPEGVEIILRRPADTHGRWNAVEVLPEGLVLSAPALLTIPYDPALDIPPGSNEDKVLGLYWNPEGPGWAEVEGAVRDSATRSVRIPLDHFSTYAANALLSGPGSVAATYAHQSESSVALLWKQPASGTAPVTYTVYRKLATEPVYEAVPSLTDLIKADIPTVPVGTSVFYQVIDREVVNQWPDDEKAYQYCIRAKDALGVEGSCPSYVTSAVPHIAFATGSTLSEGGERIVDQKGLGDVNNDGYPDLAGWSVDGSEIILNLAHPPATPQDPPAFDVLHVNGQGFPGRYGTSDVLLRDFNGDGNLDIACSGSSEAGQPGIRILSGNGAGSFAQRAEILLPLLDPQDTLPPAPVQLGAADLDGDGKNDLIVSFEGTKPLWFARNQTSWGSSSIVFSGFAESGLELPPPGEFLHGPMSRIAFGDLNSDSLPDIVIGLANYRLAFDPDTVTLFPSKNRVLINQGGLRFIEQRQNNWPEAGAETASIHLMDLDGDGALDLIEGVAGAPMIYYRGKGNGFFGAPEQLDGTPQDAESILSADLDHDGDEDVIVASKAIYYYSPTCPPKYPNCPHYVVPFVTSENVIFRNIRVAITGGYQSVLVPTGERISPELEFAQPCVALADLDRDGDLDALAYPLIQTSLTYAPTAYASSESSFQCTGPNEVPPTPLSLAFSYNPASYVFTIGAPAQGGEKTPTAALTYEVVVKSASGQLLFGSEAGSSTDPQVGTSSHPGALGYAKTLTISRLTGANPQGVDLGSNFNIYARTQDGSRSYSGWKELTSQTTALLPPTLTSATWIPPSNGVPGHMELAVSDWGGGTRYKIYYGFQDGMWMNFPETLDVPTVGSPVYIEIYGLTCSQLVYVAVAGLDPAGNESAPSLSKAATATAQMPSLSVPFPASQTGAPTILRADRVYEVASTYTVPKESRVVIEPGAHIYFKSAAALTVNGTLEALGAECAPIVFTSIKDKSGTTPSAGNWGTISLHPSEEAIPRAVRMDHCRITYGGSSSTAQVVKAKLWGTGNAISLTNIEVAHSLGNGISVESGETAPVAPLEMALNKVNVHHFGSAGVEIIGETVNKIALYAPEGLLDWRITNETGPAVRIAQSSPAEIVGPGTIAATIVDGRGIEWLGGSWGVPVRLYDLGLPYKLMTTRILITASGALTLSGRATIEAAVSLDVDGSLMLEPGSRIKFASGKQLNVNGSLFAVGTATEKIVLTSMADEPTEKGGWNGLILHPSTNSLARSAVLSHCSVRHGGGASTSKCPLVKLTLWQTASTASITDTEISHGNSDGLAIASGTKTQESPFDVVVTDLWIHHNGGVGIDFDGEITSKILAHPPISIPPSLPTQVNLTINDNAGVAIRYKLASPVELGPGQIDAANNDGGARERIEWLGGSWGVPVRFYNLGLPYELVTDIGTITTSGALTLSEGTAILAYMSMDVNGSMALEPGSKIQFASGKQLNVDGSLFAGGTATQKVAFTSMADGLTEVGGWKGLILHPSTSSVTRSVVLSHCSVRHGGLVGAMKYPLVQQTLWPSGSAVSITDTEMAYGSGDGLSIASSATGVLQVMLDDLVVHNNGGVGIDFGSVLLGLIRARPNDGSMSLIISDNTEAAIRYGVNSPVELGPGHITASGNGGGIEWHGGSWGVPVRLYDLGLPYDLTTTACTITDSGAITLSEGATIRAYMSFADVNGTMTLEAGSSIRFADDKYLKVNGSLSVSGTAARKVVLTSLADVPNGSPVPGGWKGLILHPAAAITTRNVVLSHCSVKYGGTAYGSLFPLIEQKLWLSNSSVQMSDLELAYGASDGLELMSGEGAESSGAPLPVFLSRVAIHHNGGDGLRTSGNMHHSIQLRALQDVLSVGIDHNAGAAICFSPSSPTEIIGTTGDLSFASNTKDEILWLGGSWAAPVRMYNVGYPYKLETNAATVDGAFHISAGVPLFLKTNMTVNGDWEIEPGATIRSGTYTTIRADGSFSATGTEMQKIIFSSLTDVGGVTPAPGDWYRMLLHPTAPERPRNVTMRHCAFRYGGFGSAGPTLMHELWTGDGAISIEDTEISLSAGDGLLAQAGSSGALPLNYQIPYRDISAHHNNRTGIRFIGPGSGKVIVDALDSTDNGLLGLELSAVSEAEVRNCVFYGNNNGGLQLNRFNPTAGTPIRVNASLCFWGDTNPDLDGIPVVPDGWRISPWLKTRPTADIKVVSPVWDGSFNPAPGYSDLEYKRAFRFALASELGQPLDWRISIVDSAGQEVFQAEKSGVAEFTQSWGGEQPSLPPGKYKVEIRDPNPNPRYAAMTGDVWADSNLYMAIGEPAGGMFYGNITERDLKVTGKLFTDQCATPSRRYSTALWLTPPSEPHASFLATLSVSPYCTNCCFGTAGQPPVLLKETPSGAWFSGTGTVEWDGNMAGNPAKWVSVTSPFAEANLLLSVSPAEAAGGTASPDQVQAMLVAGEFPGQLSGTVSIAKRTYLHDFSATNAGGPGPCGECAHDYPPSTEVRYSVQDQHVATLAPAINTDSVQLFPWPAQGHGDGLYAAKAEVQATLGGQVYNRVLWDGPTTKTVGGSEVDPSSLVLAYDPDGCGKFKYDGKHLLKYTLDVSEAGIFGVWAGTANCSYPSCPNPPELAVLLDLHDRPLTGLQGQSSGGRSWYWDGVLKNHRYLPTTAAYYGGSANNAGFLMAELIKPDEPGCSKTCSRQHLPLEPYEFVLGGYEPQISPVLTVCQASGEKTDKVVASVDVLRNTSIVAYLWRLGEVTDNSVPTVPIKSWPAQASANGTFQIVFDGKLDGIRLAGGMYEIEVVATDSAGVSQRAFQVVPIEW